MILLLVLEVLTYMKILVIDGQGGRVGRLLIEGLKQQAPQLYITCLLYTSIVITFEDSFKYRVSFTHNQI